MMTTELSNILSIHEKLQVNRISKCHVCGSPHRAASNKSRARSGCYLFNRSAKVARAFVKNILCKDY